MSKSKKSFNQRLAEAKLMYPDLTEAWLTYAIKYGNLRTAAEENAAYREMMRIVDTYGSYSRENLMRAAKLHRLGAQATGNLRALEAAKTWYKGEEEYWIQGAAPMVY